MVLVQALRLVLDILTFCSGLPDTCGFIVGSQGDLHPRSLPTPCRYWAWNSLVSLRDSTEFQHSPDGEFCVSEGDPEQLELVLVLLAFLQIKACTNRIHQYSNVLLMAISV